MDTKMAGASDYLYKMCEDIDFWAVFGVVVGASLLLLLCAFLCLKPNRPTCCRRNPFICPGGAEDFDSREKRVVIVRENATKVTVGDVEKGLTGEDGSLKSEDDPQSNSDREMLIQNERLTKILEE